MSTRASSSRAQHALFQPYPLQDCTISVGQVPTPYHIYDGRIAFIGGTADLAAVQSLLHHQHQQLIPLKTQDGRALMTVWICDFTEASLGPHQEVQISVFASEKPMPPAASHPFTILELVSFDPNVKMLCHGLWNDTQTVVAYNRDRLGLDARLTKGTIQPAADSSRTTFRFVDGEGGTSIIEGQFAKPRSQPLRPMWTLMRGIGWANTMRMAQMPHVALKVVNTISPLMAFHSAAQTYTKNDAQIIRLFDPQVDQLTFGDSRYQSLGFAPQFVSYSTGCRMVYLDPVPITDRQPAV